MAMLIFGSIGCVFSVLVSIVTLCWIAKAAMEYVIETKDLYQLVVVAMFEKAKQERTK